jgi:hypothetical protein
MATIYFSNFEIKPKVLAEAEFSSYKELYEANPTLLQINQF